MTFPRQRIAILISGRGSNMMSLVEAARAAEYPAEVVAVIANRPDAAGIPWAAARGIATAIVDHTAYTGRAPFEAALDAALAKIRPDFVCLAGFMRVLTADFVGRWEGRLINIHPSLLPSFKGLHTHQQALAAGVRIAGCTVHFVVPEMDAGPIIAQAAVPVIPGDTADSLAARILLAEHKLYPHALGLVATGHISMQDGQAVVARGPAGLTLASVDNTGQLYAPPLDNPT